MMEEQIQPINIDKIVTNFTRRDFYKQFVKNNKDIKISERQFSIILTKIHDRIMDKILNENYVFKMPHLHFRIKVIKTKRNVFDKNGNLIPFMFPVDWQATRQLWKDSPEKKAEKKLIYHLNDHTNGYIYRIKMLKSIKSFKNSKYYVFRASRPFQRKLAKILKDPYNKKDYYEL